MLDGIRVHCRDEVASAAARAFPRGSRPWCRASGRAVTSGIVRRELSSALARYSGRNTIEVATRDRAVEHEW